MTYFTQQRYTRNNNDFFEMCSPFIFNRTMIDNYKNLHQKEATKCTEKATKKRASKKKIPEKKQPTYYNTLQTLFSYNFHIIEMLYKDFINVSENDPFDKYFEKDKHHTLFLEFQQYKAPLYSLLENNQAEIKTLGLKPSIIMEKFLEFNEKQGKKGKTNSYDFEVDVFLSLLRCMKVNCIFVLHKVAFIMNDDVNEKYVFIGYDYSKTKTMFGGREMEKYLNNSEIEYNNNNGKYKYPYFCVSLGETEFHDLKNYVVNECFVIDTISKPIKAASSYKLNELQSITQKLNIDDIIVIEGKQKKKTKQQLYSDIIGELRNVNIIAL